jgi:nitrogen fixation protein NifU and related proteins
MIDEDVYKENIIEHYKCPINKSEMQDPTHKHKELNPLCGDEITIYLKIEEDKIANVSFTGKGCAISQASISMLTEKLMGLDVDTAKDITKEDIFEMLGIPISYSRMKCALLSLKVVLKGLEVQNVRNY